MQSIEEYGTTNRNALNVGVHSSFLVLFFGYATKTYLYALFHDSVSLPNVLLVTQSSYCSPFRTHETPSTSTPICTYPLLFNFLTHMAPPALPSSISTSQCRGCIIPHFTRTCIRHRCHRAENCSSSWPQQPAGPASWRAGPH